MIRQITSVSSYSKRKCGGSGESEDRKILNQQERVCGVKMFNRLYTSFHISFIIHPLVSVRVVDLLVNCKIV